MHLTSHQVTLSAEYSRLIEYARDEWNISNKNSTKIQSIPKNMHMWILINVRNSRWNKNTENLTNFI